MSAQQVVVKQVRSKVRVNYRQRATLQALGLGRIGTVVEHNLTPSVEGMLRAVSHLVSVTPKA